MDFTNKKALVIGASSQGGLGEAVAIRLAGQGCHVTVAARRLDAVTALAEQIGGAALPCDVTDEASLQAAIEKAGPLDIIVNAAGTTCSGGLRTMQRSQLEEQMAVHFTANALLLKHAIPAMPNGGAVVLFSSVTSALAGSGMTAYSCAKAAGDQLVRVAAVELGDRGIRVNAVAPGFSKTPMTEAIFNNPAAAAMYLGHVPIGKRSVTPEEVASAVAWLCADDCFVTGEILQVSGGAQLGRLPNTAELKQMWKG